jgi:competence protein ComFA
VEKVFICAVCHNQDPIYIGYLNHKPYCRRCLPFHGDIDLEPIKEPILAPLYMSYSLTQEQLKISQQLIACYHLHQSVLIDAVTGSGKTEIVLGLIQVVLAQKQRIAFVVPRKDVVIELFHRFKQLFPTIKMQALYGGQSLIPHQDFYVMTTHQVYQFNHQFDAMILDETDAFPYEGNPVLHALFKRASKGFFVLMSATFSSAFLQDYLRQGWAVFHLHKRYHGQPIPIPTIIYCLSVFQWTVVLYWIEKFQTQKKRVLIFVPTINQAESLFWLLKFFAKKGGVAHSKSTHREAIIKQFKNHELDFLISTSILERGITLKHLQVIIVHSDHPLMDEKTLVQMAGRVGRKIDAPHGKVIYVAEVFTKSMEQSIKRLRIANESM